LIDLERGLSGAVLHELGHDLLRTARDGVGGLALELVGSVGGAVPGGVALVGARGGLVGGTAGVRRAGNVVVARGEGVGVAALLDDALVLVVEPDSRGVTTLATEAARRAAEGDVG